MRAGATTTVVGMVLTCSSGNNCFKPLQHTKTKSVGGAAFLSNQRLMFVKIFSNMTLKMFFENKYLYVHQFHIRCSCEHSTGVSGV